MPFHMHPITSFWKILRAFITVWLIVRVRGYNVRWQDQPKYTTNLTKFKPISEEVK